jgi:hypothetical protein
VPLCASVGRAPSAPIDAAAAATNFLRDATLAPFSARPVPLLGRRLAA